MAVAEFPLPPFPYEKDFFKSPFPKGGKKSALPIFGKKSNKEKSNGQRINRIFIDTHYSLQYNKTNISLIKEVT